MTFQAHFMIIFKLFTPNKYYHKIHLKCQINLIKLGNKN